MGALKRSCLPNEYFCKHKISHESISCSYEEEKIEDILLYGSKISTHPYCYLQNAFAIVVGGLDDVKAALAVSAVMYYDRFDVLIENVVR